MRWQASSRCGTPDELKAMIDEAHHLGLTARPPPPCKTRAGPMLGRAGWHCWGAALLCMLLQAWVAAHRAKAAP